MFDFKEVIFLGFSSASLVMFFAILGLLMLSALVSGSEVAFFSIEAKEVEQLRESKEEADRGIIELLSDVDLLLATLLVVNNLVNITVAVLAANLIDALFYFGGATILEYLTKLVAVTFLLLLFGEIAPKVLAQSSPKSFARAAVRIIIAFRGVFRPLSMLLVKAGATLGSKASHHSEISVDELADAIDLADSATKEERVILSGILNFANTDVQAIMRSRVDIVAITMTESYSRVKELIIESGYSRIPVYDDNLDSIRGVLYVKDLLAHINEEDYGWQQLIRKPYFVPAHKKINVLLEEFQSSKIHIAVVVDEYGSTMGLVSLEDIIEEIVGDISDESDHEESFFTRLDKSTYIFDGKTHINDFERVLELDEEFLADLQGGTETLAGLILEVQKTLPKLGDKVEVKGIKLRVDSMGGQSGRRIEKVHVVVPESFNN
ncbi:MAG: gliding motility-associated protein GldE [Rikenellaceae bacterium]